jgi:hypothetical protein
MALNRLLELGFSALPPWSQLLVFLLVLMIQLSLFTCHLVVRLLLYVDDMIITGDYHEYIAFVKTRLSYQFLMCDPDPLRYFLGIEISTTEGFFLSQEKNI